MEDRLGIILVLAFSPLGWIAAILAVSLVISITTHIKYLITGKI